MGTKFRISGRLAIFFCVPALVFFFGFECLLAQESVSPAQSVEVVETNVDFDQMVPEVVNQKVRLPEDPLEIQYNESAGENSLRFGGEQISTINQTLKKVIEENEKLRRDNQGLDKQLRALRGQREIELNRINLVTQEMKGIRDQTEKIVEANQDYTRQVFELKNALKEKDKEYELKLKELKGRLNEDEDWEDVALGQKAVQPVTAPAPEKKFSKEDVFALLGKLDKQSQRFKEDAVRVHYNLGNTYFQKGKYRQAVEEYKKALELSPSDAAAHFNLAYVSIEHLRDPHTAVRHFQEYLFLLPDAEDAPLVREKIIQAELEIRGRIHSPLDIR